jgi:hypothetical protein
MERLIAHFTIALAEPILVEDVHGAKRAFMIEHDAYEIEVAWDDEDVHERITKRSARRPSYGISTIRISVSQPETEPYSEDVDERNSYLGPRLEVYANVATTIANRLIKYFKFTLGNPLLQEVRPEVLRDSNPKWTDENEVPLRPPFFHVRAQGFSGLLHSPAFGIKAFTREQSHELMEALGANTSYEMYEELIVDARASVVQGNFRRAVLEMAIACEVTTKQLFFKKATPAGDAFEYLEDKARINISVPELLDKVSDRAFGKGFRQSYPKDWQNSEYLFQCRNKVAHPGVLHYNNQQGNPQNVDIGTLKAWWDSLETLIAWVRSQ